MTTKANKLVHYWSDDRICGLIERIAELTAEVERLRENKPKCPDCNAVGMSHCSDPEHCGGVYWPDKMYRALEAENTRLKAESAQHKLETAVTLEVLTRIANADQIHEATSAILAARAAIKEGK